MKLFKRRVDPVLLDLTQVTITPLHKRDVCNQFDCGQEPLNRFLKNRALKVSRRFEQRVFSARLDGSKRCIGYYALQLGADTVAETPHRRRGYIENHTAFPAVHLSYLAVDEPFQGQKLGEHLLMDVFDRVAAISEHAGFFALTLQSINEHSTRFYERIGFEIYSHGGKQPKMLYPIATLLEIVKNSSPSQP